MKISKGDKNLVSRYNWYEHKTGKKVYLRGYLRGNRASGMIYQHHLILGKPEKGFEVDHIDGDGTNNSRRNLRFVTRSQNNANRKNVSGFYFCKYNKSYRSDIWKNGKKIHIGVFKTKKEASEAYRIKAIELFGKASSRSCL